MALKTYKPYTPSRRFMTTEDFSDITTDQPYKPLTKFIRSQAGRNNTGQVTIRHRGGGHKRRYRMVDFKGWDKNNIPATVKTVEYDPHRNARIVLLQFIDGEKRYALGWKGVAVGDNVMCGDQAKLTPGNRKQLKDIPDGFTVYNLEVTPQTKGKLIRSAGASAAVTGRDDEQGIVYIKLPSSEVRKFHAECWATIGMIGNEDFKNMVIGKAGRMRWMGRRPVVRGKEMNPVDHPHG